MKKLSEEHKLKFRYDSEKEREEHVKEMESKGFVCLRKFSICWDYPIDENSKHEPYAEFWKLV